MSKVQKFIEVFYIVCLISAVVCWVFELAPAMWLLLCAAIIRIEIMEYRLAAQKEGV